MAGVQASGADVRSHTAERGPVARASGAKLLGEELVGLPQGQGEPRGGTGPVCRPRGESLSQTSRTK